MSDELRNWLEAARVIRDGGEAVVLEADLTHDQRGAAIRILSELVEKLRCPHSRLVETSIILKHSPSQFKGDCLDCGAPSSEIAPEHRLKDQACRDCGAETEADLMEACPHLDAFLRDPQRALLFAKEALMLSLSCRLHESMEKHGVTKEELERRAQAPVLVEAILDGTQSEALTTLDLVARLFWAMGEQVEITTKPIRGSK